jgi:four helix bundle protein
MGIKCFTELGVWQKAHDLRHTMSRIADTFPAVQQFVVARQLRKAAHSIPANIAEGFGRRYIADKIRIYNISEASAEELKDALICARDERWPFDFRTNWDGLEEVCRMLKGLIRTTEEWGRRTEPNPHPDATSRGRCPGAGRP